MKAQCENCGDKTSFNRAGEREPDFEREVLGWCRRCWKILHKNEEQYAKVYIAAKRAYDEAMASKEKKA